MTTATSSTRFVLTGSRLLLSDPPLNAAADRPQDGTDEEPLKNLSAAHAAKSRRLPGVDESDHTSGGWARASKSRSWCSDTTAITLAMK
ncbi:hypothetical protein ACIQPS_36350 [Streptomyces sp. NPDC091290]|uniref:hypothetical protein n=1 Tax=Streptomyces sp. NPDC091290 TaxID=3365990 RepID=UPI0037F66257